MDSLQYIVTSRIEWIGSPGAGGSFKIILLTSSKTMEFLFFATGWNDDWVFDKNARLGKGLIFDDEDFRNGSAIRRKAQWIWWSLGANRKSERIRDKVQDSGKIFGKELEQFWESADLSRVCRVGGKDLGIFLEPDKGRESRVINRAIEVKRRSGCQSLTSFDHWFCTYVIQPQLHSPAYPITLYAE